MLNFFRFYEFSLAIIEWEVLEYFTEIMYVKFI